MVTLCPALSTFAGKHAMTRYLPIFLLLLAWPAASPLAAEETQEQARKIVWDFERTLFKKSNPDDVEGIKKTELRIREFFNGLNGRTLKLEAIGMMDSRYVYHISRQQTAE